LLYRYPEYVLDAVNEDCLGSDDENDAAIALYALLLNSAYKWNICRIDVFPKAVIQHWIGHWVDGFFGF